MQIQDLFEKQKRVVPSKYNFLYHLTDNSGFAYSIAGNALKALRQDYVSTTYDPNKNYVYGYSHYDFKFILNGTTLINRYGAFYHDHKIRTSDNKFESLDEKEIGIKTKTITPLNQYLFGVVLLFPLISEKAIRWLMYDNPEETSFSGIVKEAAPRAIEMLYVLVYEWNKPLYINASDNQRLLNTKEKEFLKDILNIHKRGGNHKDAMLELADKYSITDFDNHILDKKTVFRRQRAAEIMKLYNDYYTSRQYKNVDPSVSQHLIMKSMQILDLNSNIQQTIIHELKSNNLFHKVIAPVDWTIIIRPLMDGDIDEAINAIQRVGKSNQYKIQRYEDDPEDYNDVYHVGSHMK